MRDFRAILAVGCMLFISMFAHVSCNKYDKQSEIQEVDKKYLSESQLFGLHMAIESDPDNSENYYKRAKVYFDRKNKGKALADITEAIKLNKEEGKYYLLQAKILGYSKQYSLAINAAKTAEKLKVPDAEINILLSRLYLGMGQKNEAQNYLLQAAQLTPFNPDILFIKGKLAAINGDTTSAVVNYFETIKKDTINIEAYKELSKIYYIKQKYDSAMMFLSIGKLIEPEDPFFYFMEGEFLSHLNMKESSKVSYLNSIKIDSTYPEAYNALAMINYKENNTDAAVKYFEKELKYNPNASKSGMYLSELYEKQNRGYLAIPLLEKELKKDSLNTKAKSALERLYVLYPKKVEIVKDTVKTVVVDTVKTFSKIDTNKTQTTSVKKDTTKVKVAPKKEKKTDTSKKANKIINIINPDSLKIETSKDTANIE